MTEAIDDVFSDRPIRPPFDAELEPVRPLHPHGPRPPAHRAGFPLTPLLHRGHPLPDPYNPDHPAVPSSRPGIKNTY
ncbi:hypothetical protein KMT30_37195 [Streptomyces sp. IBSBF 2953]|nr:hypothetical protein [Streptomyces hayashii]